MTSELLIQELLVRKPCWGLCITSEQHLQNIQHTYVHFFCSTVQFVCYLSVLNCNLKVSDGNCILLRLFKRYCALLEVNIKPEKLQYYNRQEKAGKCKGVSPACLHKNISPMLPAWLHRKASTIHCQQQCL